MAYKDKERERQNKKEYYRENKEKILQYRKKYYRKNRERIIQNKKDYYQRNREKIQKRMKLYHKVWYQKNKREIRKQIKKWPQKNKARLQQCNKEWYQKNRKKILQKQENYYQKNKEVILQHHRMYNLKNKERLLQYKGRWQKYKRKTDPKYRLDENMGSAIARSLKDKKAKRPWEALVNYTLEELMRHLEKQFDNKMSWDNYGSYWAVDHVKPRGLFNYTAPDDLVFKQCWALKNLQPLEKIENIKKRNHLID